MDKNNASGGFPYWVPVGSPMEGTLGLKGLTVDWIGNRETLYR